MGTSRTKLLAATLTVLLGSLSLSATAGAQATCDPYTDPDCIDDTYEDPGDTYDPNPPYDPTYDEPVYEEPYDPALDDTYYGPDDTSAPYDPTYQPGDTYDPNPPYDPALDDPYYGPDNTSVPYDPALDPYGCDPYVDSSCASPGPYDTIYYGPDVTAAPAQPSGPVAFADVPDAIPAVAAVVTRADTSDDVPIANLNVTEAVRVGASRMVLATDAIAELGGFARTIDPEANATLRTIRTEVPGDGLSDDGYRTEINRFVSDLTVLVELLEGSGVDVHPDVVALQSSLSPEVMFRLSSGDTAVIDADVWVDGLTALAAYGGANVAAGADPGTEQAAVLSLVELFAAPVPSADNGVAVAPDEVASSPTSDPAGSAVQTAADDSNSAALEAVGTGSSGAAPVVLIAAVVGGVILLAGAVAFVRRRRDDEPVVMAETTKAAKLSLNDLLDASRRMTSSLDQAEIARIALAEAQRLVKAEGGVVVLRNGADLTPILHEPAQLFALGNIDASSLRRVVETGRSLTAVATDEPVLVEVPMAMAAVPIVAEGTVAGALMVVRVSSQPFDREDLDALEMLAPLVGSAFQAAETHGSATEMIDVEPMTGLMNRRRLDRDMAAVDENQPVAYVMVDVDHFKNFNDVNGHAAGDEALRQVANALSASVRPGDVVYRYGGEEFCVLLTDSTVDDALVVAERARAMVESTSVPGAENQPGGKLTISVGVSDTATGPIGDLIERADAALYEAKESGRNQVCVSEP